MKIKDYKCKCGHDDFFFIGNGISMGIYCSYCGKWFKWADKNERNLSMQAQKIGHWIDKTRGDQKNSECSECHTLFRVLIKDYPYCPVCGSRNGGDNDG